MDNADARGTGNKIVLSSSAAGGEIVYTQSMDEFQIRLLLSRAKTLQDFFCIILKIVNRLGFSDCSFTRLSSRNDPDAHLVTTHQKISDHYKDKAVWSNDLMIGHGTNQTGPKFQSEIDQFVLGSPVDPDWIITNRASIQLRFQLGYFDYYGISMKAVNGNGNVLFAITSKNVNVIEFREKIERAKASLHLLAGAIDHVGTRKFSEFFLEPGESDVVSITPQPLRLLTLMATTNMRLKEVAEFMGITINTANDHMKAAKKALGAPTPARAVFLAIKAKLIDIRAETNSK